MGAHLWCALIPLIPTESSELTTQTYDDRPVIALLGIGLMGYPMACRLLDAGFALTAWNRSAEKSAPLAVLGARIASTPAAAVASAQVIVTMLESGAAVAQVLDASIDAIAASALVIDMSSTAQSEALVLHARLCARGIACLDAPVSGGVGGAESGRLAIMVGGTPGDFQRATSVFAALGHATLVGSAGAGQVAKLCNQLIVGATLNIVAEALLLAQGAGADPAAVRQALCGGFADSTILTVHGQRMLERDFRPGGQIKSQVKDLENVLLAAAAAGLHLPLTELVSAHYRTLLASAPHADHSAILLALEYANPGQRLGMLRNRLP